MTSEFSGDRNLLNDAYKIFLSKKYNIRKNDLFNQFEVNNSKLFGTLDEALQFAYHEELKTLNEQENNTEIQPPNDSWVKDAFAKKRQEMFEQQTQNNDKDLPPVNQDNLIESNTVIEGKENSVKGHSYTVEIFALVLVVVIILGVFFIFQNEGVLENAKPSFDCSKAKHKTELEICKEPSLAKLDFENAELFKKASNINPAQAKQTLNNSVKNRYKCQGDYNCIKSSFQQSIDVYKSIINSNSSSMNNSQDENQAKEKLAFRLGECAGFYYFAAYTGDPIHKDLKLNMSDSSLQIANAATKIPMYDLEKIRDDTVSKLNDKFDQLVRNNDNHQLITWGKGVGAKQNECTQSLQNISDMVLKRK
jgi:uncharacterized protein